MCWYWSGSGIECNFVCNRKKVNTESNAVCGHEEQNYFVTKILTLNLSSILAVVCI